MLLSVVVPCYNEELNINDFYQALLPAFDQIVSNHTQVSPISLEILYVDDGSTDQTANCVKTLIETDSRVRLISFSRNFGKESAIFAGLEKALGDYVVIMDADLQDPPSLLPQMFTEAMNGYDHIATRRVSRKGEPAIRSFFARRFYRLMRVISRTEIVDGARDYRLLSRKVVDAILSLREYHRFTKGIFGWVGFETKWLEYENIERAKGETKWSFWKLLKYSIEGIVAFSTVPLIIASIIGVVFCIIAFLMILFVVIRKILFGDPVSGWASTICILLLVSGVQFFCMGIIGQYLAKTYMEVKNRPLYLIKEEL
ncbi:MAG: glycosyltransferase family 2 protein [Lachnospiraceae bacterium]|jgi:glycosyltransferase involved in cell wall biosynthesis|nr:glycosyltransferase family 2 protein [Lachnospiraceae bacterium]